jgi:16S rRNA (adenine1518-N6/adenine1519-N6)-dimethyltransferase
VQRFDVQSLLQKLSEMGVRPNKKLGQNFLINKSVCERIVAEVFKKNPSHIVEVGPGLGALTDLVLEKDIPVTLIELDRSFAEYWQTSKAKVIHKDALQLDWSTLALPEKTLFLSNLPYQISSSLVIERSIDPQNIDRMVLMFQKEVGQRLLAAPQTEDYGLLTVVAQAFWRVQQLMDVGAKDFYPPPQVASRVLIFDWKSAEIPNPKSF